MKGKNNIHNSIGERGRSVINGTLALTLSTITVKLLGVIYKVPLARFLGDEGMGYFNSAYTVYTFFYLLCTAGVPKAVMIIVSEAKSNGDGTLEKNIIRVASYSFLLLGVGVTIIFSVFSAPLAKMIGNSRAAYTMLAVAPSIIFISLAGVIRGALSAEMKFSAIAVSQVIEGVARLVLGLLFAMYGISRGLELPVISALTILGATFGALFGLLYLLIISKTNKKREKTRQNIEKTVKRTVLKRIFSISLPITVSAAVMSITGIIDLGQIMRTLTSLGYSETEASALYGNYTTLAVPMFNLVIAVITPVSITYLPVFTKARTSANLPLLSDSLRSSVDMSSFLCAPLVVGIMCYSEEILRLLFGEAGIEVGAPLLVILIIGAFFMSGLLIVNSLLESFGKAKVPVIGMLIGSSVKIIVSRILLKNPNIGVMGAPIGTVLSYVISLSVSLWYAEKRLEISVPVIGTSLPHYIRAAVAILPTLFLKEWLSGVLGSTLSFLLCLFVCAIQYFAVSFFTGVFGKEKLKKMSKYTNFA